MCQLYLSFEESTNNNWQNEWYLINLYIKVITDMHNSLICLY